MKKYAHRLFTALCAASISALFAGCSGEDPQPTDGYVGIFTEAAGRGAAGVTTTTLLPDSKKTIALARMAVVPTGGFAILQVAVIPDPVVPGQQILGFLARVDDGTPSKQIRQASIRGQGQRLILMTARIVNTPTGPTMEYTPIGTHVITGEIRSGDVFFIAEVPAADDIEREAKMHKIAAEVNATILYLKKAAEK